MKTRGNTMKLGRMTNLEQADAMLIMLLSNGREVPSEDRFIMCHDDVMMMLELIRECVLALNE